MIEMIPEGHSLEGVRLKLEKAQEHLVTLDCETSAFLESEPYTVTGKPEAEGTEYVFNVQVVRDPPPVWSTIIGDCLQNMRSALDHLAWQLVLKSGNTPKRGTSFPIFLDNPFALDARKELRDGFKRNVKGMRPDMVALIKELQPYASDDFSFDGLWILNELARIDRHQVLHAVGGVSIRSTWVIGEIDDSGRVLNYPLSIS
jgi:hypothetical protein